MTISTGATSRSDVALASTPRPTLYDSENQRRSEHYHVRTQMLADDFAELASEWMVEAYGQEQVDTWGPPDTTLNPIASQTRQLTTPGLYGIHPKVTGSGDLLGPDGYLARANIWSRSQQLQYMTVGIGIYFRRLSVTWDLDGETKTNVQLVDTHVNPRDVVAWVDTETGRLVELWHLRLRERLNAEGAVERFWLWDQWSVRPDKPPSLRVVEAGQFGVPGRDVSADWLTHADNSKGPMIGESYPWKRPSDGRPYLPWIVYRAVDGGDSFWPNWRRAMHSGTLRACSYWTFTARSALFSTGEHVLVGGVDTGDAPGIETKRGDNSREQGVPPQLTMRVNPGTITFLPVKAQQQLVVSKVGPGIHLPNLQAFSGQYGMLMALSEGIVSDAMRTGANPTSGAALAISATQRREFSAQVMPLFNSSDLAMLSMFSWLLAQADVTVPDDGYSIEYHTIPLSPTEQADERAQLEWEEERGQLSPVDLHIRLHPGKTREQALDAIVAARADAREVDQLVAEELALRGVDTPTQPTDVEPVDATAPAVDGDESAPAAEPELEGGVDKAADTALNGAQVTAAQGIVQAAADGKLPRDSAKTMLIEFFNLSDEAAESILGSIGNGFVPATPAVPAPFAKPATNSDDETDTEPDEESDDDEGEDE